MGRVRGHHICRWHPAHDELHLRALHAHGRQSEQTRAYGQRRIGIGKRLSGHARNEKCYEQRGFQRGVAQLVRAISPTLGPRPRHVVHQTMFQGRMPEFLDDGATIARRIVMLPDRVEDAGAMLLREMLVEVKEAAGDGTATAAVLFSSIYNQGLSFVTAGGSAMLLRRELEASEDFEDLMLLRELDSKGRVPGALVGTVDEALDAYKNVVPA